jgi:hypothetical protein
MNGDILDHNNHPIPCCLYVFRSYSDKSHIFNQESAASQNHAAKASSIQLLIKFHRNVSSFFHLRKSHISPIAAQNIARNDDTDITHAHAAVTHLAHHQFF